MQALATPDYVLLVTVPQDQLPLPLGPTPRETLSDQKGAGGTMTWLQPRAHWAGPASRG